MNSEISDRIEVESIETKSEYSNKSHMIKYEKDFNKT